DVTRSADAGAMLFDGAEEPGKLLPEFSQGRIVGHDVELRPSMEHASGVKQGRGHQCSGGILGAHLILEDLFDQALLECRGQRVRGELVYRTKVVLLPVSALEANADGLAAAAPLLGSEAAGVGLQV